MLLHASVEEDPESSQARAGSESLLGTALPFQHWRLAVAARGTASV